MQWRRFRMLTYEMLRRRMIRETEVSLAVWLERGEKVPRIPTVEVGKGVFNPEYAEAYWADRLDLR